MSLKTLFHGTPVAIHNTNEFYLKPSPGGGADIGDPEVPHAFATPNKFIASLFSLKTDNCLYIFGGKPSFIIYDGTPPPLDHHGWLYEVSNTSNFNQTVEHGQPTGKYAIISDDMEIQEDGKLGVSLNKSNMQRITLRDLINTHSLQILSLTEHAGKNAFFENMGDAISQGHLDTFIRNAITVNKLSTSYNKSKTYHPDLSQPRQN